MFIPQSYGLAVALCFITMLCWGSWANTQKLASKEWPFQLFYWDYAIGIVLMSLFFGVTFGSVGDEGRSFFADLMQADTDSFVSALIGGIVFNFANILIAAAINIAGMAVAFPIGIGLALVIGVIVNYIATPLGNPVLLFAGVALIVIAIIFDAIAYGKLSGSEKKTPMRGIVLSILGGIAMGFFYRFVAVSMSTDFANPEVGKFTPYGATFVFSIGIFLSNFIWNSIAMFKPISGESTSYGAYFKMGTPRLHLIGLLGGAIWCIGNSLSFIASEQAGYAISYGLGQGATMVAAAWGVFIWKEFASSPKGTNKLITLMFLSFIAGLVLIIVARLG